MTSAVPGRRLALAALLLALLVGLPSGARAVDDHGYVSAAIRALLATPDRELIVEGVAVDPAAHRAFYLGTGTRPLWSGGARAAERLRLLLRTLSDAAGHGLEPDAYPGAEILALSRRGTPSAAARMEILATAAFLRYARDVGDGRLTPAAVDTEFFMVAERPEAQTLLVAARRATDFAAFLDALAPGTAAYADLRYALAAYRALAAAGGWQSLPEGPTLKPGMRDAMVPALRERLIAGGDADGSQSPEAVAEPELYDDGLVTVVRGFQARHGLEVDGIVGPRTRAALDVPVQARIRQIIVNMERWRWMPDDLGERHILVNLAGFDLRMVEERETVLEMRVVVGRTYRQTPVFSDRMTYLDLNPFWTVPPSLARRDIVPRMREDPDYLEDQSIRVFASWSDDGSEMDPLSIDWAAFDGRPFPYRLRQDPGPKNALGRIKFMFPNKFDVYLHDTPAREHFRRAVRTFSSGCIRVEKPIELAARLLADDSRWSVERIVEAIDSGERRRIPLPRPIAIHIAYLTAWADGDGVVQIRPDVYERDAPLSAALGTMSAGGPM